MSCPTNYSASGKTCVSKCPSGYSATSDICIAIRKDSLNLLWLIIGLVVAVVLVILTILIVIAKKNKQKRFKKVNQVSKKTNYYGQKLTNQVGGQQQSRSVSNASNVKVP